MYRALILTLVLLLPTVGRAADPVPAPPTIVLPDAPAPPPPPPPPPPSPALSQRLGAGQLYVVRSNNPFFVLASPAPLVTQTTDTGPLKIHGVFVGGPGRPETKTFTEKYLVTVEAAGVGKVELLIVPAGATDAGQVVHRLLDVDDGSTPPKPPDPPQPPAPSDPAFAAIQAAYTAEPTTTRAADRDRLVSLYRLAVTRAKDDQKILTTNDMLGVVHEAVQSLVADRMPLVRRAVANEWNKTLPPNPATPMDATTRALWAAQLTRMASLLEACSK